MKKIPAAFYYGWVTGLLLEFENTDRAVQGNIEKAAALGGKTIKTRSRLKISE